MASYLPTARSASSSSPPTSRTGSASTTRSTRRCSTPVATPTTGHAARDLEAADSSYKRLMRTITVPAGGATLSFWVTRDTEQTWDFMFVEAHTVGADDWTTLPDVNGHTSSDTGNSCPFGSWQAIHPFLAHYQTDNGDGTCTPTGTTGAWWAATGASDGPSNGRSTSAPTPASTVEVSISYASDDVVQTHGLFVDDIDDLHRRGHHLVRGRRRHARRLDGAGRAGRQPGQHERLDGRHRRRSAAELRLPCAQLVRPRARDHQVPLRTTSARIRSATSAASSITWRASASRSRTRRARSTRRSSSTTQVGADNVVVHELSHQWYGDSVRRTSGSDIWLNEGFATYAEWLWSEHEGTRHAAADLRREPRRDPGGRPLLAARRSATRGPDHLFDGPSTCAAR